MKTNIQRFWANATVVQSAQWKDGEDGEESNGYAIFTVQSVPYVKKLGAKPFSFQVMYFGKSGHSAVPCLTVGLEVSLDGQLALDGQSFVLVASSVEFLGRNNDFDRRINDLDVNEFYKNIEQAEIPSQKQQAQEPQQQVQGVDKEDMDCEQVKSFLNTNNITRDVAQRFYASEIKNERFTMEEAQAVFCRKLESERFTTGNLRKIVQIARELVNEKSKKSASGAAAKKSSMPVYVEDENGEAVSTPHKGDCGEPVLSADFFRQEIAKVKPISFDPSILSKPLRRVSSVGVPPIPTFSAFGGKEEVYD